MNYKYGEERRFEHRRGSRGKYFLERRSRPGTQRERYEFVDRNMQPKNWTEYKKYSNCHGTYQRRLVESLYFTRFFDNKNAQGFSKLFNNEKFFFIINHLCYMFVFFFVEMNL